MSKVLDTAIEYATKYKWSIIPLKPQDKKPYIKWEPYQKRPATITDIRQWWSKYPDAMIGVITGQVSGLSVIDIDSQGGQKAVTDLLPDNFVAPTAVTPRGGMHIYLKYCPDLRTSSDVLPGVDVRSEGGYVAVPPSLSSSGKKYVWKLLKNPGKVKVPEIPSALKQVLATGRLPVSIGVADKNLFVEGRRDNDLFHAANCMIRGGLEPPVAQEVLKRLAKTCTPPFPDFEAQVKVKSALDRAIRRDRNLTQEIEDYVSITTGVFSIMDIGRILNLPTFEDRKMISVILGRMVKEGKLERAGRYSGQFRLIESSCDELSINPSQPEPLKLRWAFGLEKLVHLYPGNIVVVAGSQNAGKTAFLLDWIERNQESFAVNYFTSEMADEELNLRLFLHGKVNWKFKARERADNFADVIVPNEANLIDYLEVTDEFWKVGAVLRKIFERLGKGLAIVALQKDPEKLMGRGASFGLEKPRLYLSLNNNKLTIVKAKNWANPADNPNGKYIEFKLAQGSKFITSKPWKRGEN